MSKRLLTNMGIITTLFTIFLYFIISSSIISALPHNPLSEKVGNNSFYSILLPQQWGFFSKNPRDESYYVYDLVMEKSAVTWPNNKIENYLGLARSGRAQGTEMGLITLGISEENWTDCNEDPRQCLGETKALADVIKNKTPNPTICGDIGFIRQQPVPWAWSKNADDINMSSKIVRVNISCSQK